MAAHRLRLWKSFIFMEVNNVWDVLVSRTALLDCFHWLSVLLEDLNPAQVCALSENTYFMSIRENNHVWKMWLVDLLLAYSFSPASSFTFSSTHELFNSTSDKHAKPSLGGQELGTRTCSHYSSSNFHPDHTGQRGRLQTFDQCYESI